MDFYKAFCSTTSVCSLISGQSALIFASTVFSLLLTTGNKPVRTWMVPLHHDEEQDSS